MIHPVLSIHCVCTRGISSFAMQQPCSVEAERFGSVAAVIARLQTHHSTKFCKVPLHTYAEGGQVETVFGGFPILHNITYSYSTQSE